MVGFVSAPAYFYPASLAGWAHCPGLSALIATSGVPDRYTRGSMANYSLAQRPCTGTRGMHVRFSDLILAYASWSPRSAQVLHGLASKPGNQTPPLASTRMCTAPKCARTERVWLGSGAISMTRRKRRHPRNAERQPSTGDARTAEKQITRHGFHAANHRPDHLPPFAQPRFMTRARWS